MSKYVLANVEVPIEVHENGSIETLQSYAKIHLIREIESPNEIVSDVPPIQEQLERIFSPQVDPEPEPEPEPETEPEMMILKNEIKNEPKKYKNTSFKNKSRFKHNRTSKHDASL